MARLYYNLEEVSELYPVKVRTLRAWIYSGKLRASKVGRRWMIGKVEMERIVEAGEFKPFQIRRYR